MWLPIKLMVTMVRDGANSYYEGIELEVGWVSRQEELCLS